MRLFVAIVIAAILIAASSPIADDDGRLVVDVIEAARRLGVSRSTVFALISAGRLRTIKVGRRRLIPVAALVEFVNGACDAS